MRAGVFGEGHSVTGDRVIISSVGVAAAGGMCGSLQRSNILKSVQLWR
jgi:hypothetical protein